jgi:CheY-like chemotaxis protein
LATGQWPAVRSFLEEETMARVLLIDDEPAVRLTLDQMLEAGGHEVVQARVGHRLLDDLATETYDLVITDLHMPGLDGWDVAAWIAERRPGIPVIAIGGNADAARRGQERLFAAVMVKPFRRQALLATVAAVLSP